MENLKLFGMVLLAATALFVTAWLFVMGVTLAYVNAGILGVVGYLALTGIAYVLTRVYLKSREDEPTV